MRRRQGAQTVQVEIPEYHIREAILQYVNALRLIPIRHEAFDIDINPQGKSTLYCRKEKQSRTRKD